MNNTALGAERTKDRISLSAMHMRDSFENLGKPKQHISGGTD